MPKIRYNVSKEVKDLFRRIEVKMASLGMKRKDLANEISMPYSTLTEKMQGKTKFTLDEALSIKMALGAEESVEELFAATEP